MKRIRFSKITSERVLSKTLRFKNDEIVSEGGGKLSEGVVEVMEVESLEEFGQLVIRSGPKKAFCYGIPDLEPGELKKIVSLDQLYKESCAIARTNYFFKWYPGPSIMMFDIDAGDLDKIYSPEETVGIIRQAIPALETTDLLCIPSSSSSIYDENTGKLIRALHGLRFYTVVDDGREIERIGKILSERLWLMGYGRIKIGKRGSMLPRTLVDGSVYQPSRLDFVGGAFCEEPLKQVRGEPMLFKATAGGKAC